MTAGGAFGLEHRSRLMHKVVPRGVGCHVSGPTGGDVLDLPPSPRPVCM